MDWIFHINRSRLILNGINKPPNPWGSVRIPTISNQCNIFTNAPDRLQQFCTDQQTAEIELAL